MIRGCCNICSSVPSGSRCHCNINLLIWIRGISLLMLILQLMCHNLWLSLLLILRLYSRCSRSHTLANICSSRGCLKCRIALDGASRCQFRGHLLLHQVHDWGQLLLLLLLLGLLVVSSLNFIAFLQDMMLLLVKLWMLMIRIILRNRRRFHNHSWRCHNLLPDGQRWQIYAASSAWHFSATNGAICDIFI